MHYTTKQHKGEKRKKTTMVMENKRTQKCQTLHDGVSNEHQDNDVEYDCSIFLVI
jgi:hypothetical protein